MRVRSAWRLWFGALWLASVGAAAAEPVGPWPGGAALLPDHLVEGFTGDLSEMRERRVVRALVTLGRPDFFFEAGRPAGIQADILREFEKFLNRTRLPDTAPIQVAFVPVAFDDLLPALRDGRGDVAAAFLTITPERLEKVSIASGRGLRVDEVVVAHRGVEGLESLEDLSGRSVHVPPGSSYAEHLHELSARLVAAGRAPVDIRAIDPARATGGLLELVDQGICEITVVDDFRARLWAAVLPGLVVREDLAVHRGGHVGWAVRRDNPGLFQATEVFLRKVKKGSVLGNILFERYYGDTRWIADSLGRRERERIQEYVDLFRTYGERYGFDWRAIAAQAYAESALDHRRRSPRGAVGLMQIRPSTARDPRIGIQDVSDLESNVHAGVKYLAMLRDRYFAGPEFSDEDRLAFSLAAYNAGPSRVRRMQDRAEEMGLDRHRWFDHTEYAALDREPVSYVSRVYKYYLAYRLAADLLAGDEVWVAR